MIPSKSVIKKCFLISLGEFFVLEINIGVKTTLLKDTAPNTKT